MKYGLWIDQWLYYLNPMIKSSTRKQYKQYSERLVKPELGIYDLEELTSTLLQSFVTRMTERYSPATVKVIVSILKRSLGYAEEMGVTDKILSEKIKYKCKLKQTIKCLTPKQQKKLESYVYGVKTPKLYGFIICLYTGIRVGELLALTWSDIDFKTGTMYIRKTCHDGYEGCGYTKIIDTPKTASSKREIPLSKYLISILKEQKRQSKSEYVITGADGKIISKRSYQNTFGIVLKRLNIPHMGMHALRHTFATRALECGMDVKTLAEILGHNNAAMTLNVYAHSLPEHKRNMMNRVSKSLAE